ncbi:hypothetical protein E2562_017974 [Oryza meyeriana var. granulata]|uniref:NAC domain-containing protein n=1 Tax=Oryza meyeriana var. granulata TaxID=110450 RepID=A0A6G1F964_9ORYZ|nr:hypothetical protein E2562_017974 [Oryza meyeriana var. granulata]
MAALEDGEDKKGVDEHGVPSGFHFAPNDEELLDILDVKLSGRPLHREHDAVSHEVWILDFHPAKLYGIHRLSLPPSLPLVVSFFFGEGAGTRQFRGLKRNQPQLTATGGRWTIVGTSYETVKSQKVTMVFYEDGLHGGGTVNTKWRMLEFTRIISNEVNERLGEHRPTRRSEGPCG